MPATNETALEQTFSDIAYSHLRDKTQSLLDYLVGFQMLKQEDDGERAVGLFGFEIDGDYYYVPAFFLNGEIRGLDSIYSVKSDLFMPLTDAWVGMLIDQRQVRLGEADTSSKSERGTHVPDYSRMKIIPSGGSSNLKLASVMMGQPEREETSLTDIMSKSGVASLFKQAIDANPVLREQFESFGYNYMDLVDEEQPERKIAAAEEPVLIINSVTDEGVDAITDEQRETIISGGTVVIDNRPEVAKAQVFRTEAQKELENPTGGGLYDVIWADGTVSPAIIASDGSGTNQVFVYKTDDSRYGLIKSSKVFVTRKYSCEEMRDWLSSNGKKPSEVRANEVVTFISNDGDGTAIFCVETTTTGVDGITVLGVDKHGYMPEIAYEPDEGRGNNGDGVHNTFKDLYIGGNGAGTIANLSNRPGNPNYRVEQVLVTEVGGSDPRYNKRQLVVNDKCFTALVVNGFKMHSYDNGPGEYEEYNKPLSDVKLECEDFGCYNTVMAALDKVATDLRAWSVNGETSIKIGSEVTSFRKEADGLRYLIGNLGIAEGDARSIIKEASSVPEVYKLRQTTKTAAQLLVLPDPQDESGGGIMSSYHPQQVPFATANVAQSPYNREFYDYMSPFGPGVDGDGADTFGVLEQAGKTGQKEVFDAAALGSLIKSHTPTDLVDRFLPTITAGMDRIGRMLFLINWHYEDFEDRYGDNDLSEFIDNLRAVFEQMGDVVMFAKKRTLAGDPEHFGMGAMPVMES